MTDDPDEELLRRVASGDPGAVRMLVTAKLPRLLALATRLLGDAAEAEDVAQETFMRIWRNAGGWRWQGARFDTWVHRVAVNLCYDRLRRRREIPVAAPPEVPDGGPAPDAALTADEAHGSAVERALRSIAPRQREAIVLIYYQGLSNQDAASLMKVSVEALESLLARGRRSLQTLLVGGARAMTIETTMTHARFAALAQAYGGRLERWPADVREAAAIIARSAGGQALLAEAAGLDALLDTYEPSQPSAALIGRIIASARHRLAARRRLMRWWLGLGVVGIGLAGGVAGAVTVVAVMPPPEPRWAMPAGTLTAFGDFRAEPDPPQDAP